MPTDTLAPPAPAPAPAAPAAAKPAPSAPAASPAPSQKATAGVTDRLRQRFGAPDPAPGQKPKPKPPEAKPKTPDVQKLDTSPTEKPDDQPEETPDGEKPDPETKPDAGKPVPEAKPGETNPEAGKKVDPWKLVNEYKARNKKSEARIAELEKGGAKPEVLKPLEERATKAEARAKELENELAFHDFSKSPKFVEEFQKPYERAWSTAMGELKELTIEDQNGGSRAFAANDLLQLVNLPLMKADALAKELVGAEFSGYVMNARNELKALLDKRQNALDDAHRNGSENLRKRMDEQQAVAKKVTDEVRQYWDAENEAALNDPAIAEFIKPVEGDVERNSRLKNGYKLVDDGWSSNPENPDLTPEQRRDIIKKHTAIRNRAAAYGVMKYLLKKMQQESAEYKKKLAEYEGSEPSVKGDEEKPNPTPVNTGGGIRSVGARLRARFGGQQ